MTATDTWRELLRYVLDRGRPVEQASAGAAFRGRTSLEVLQHTTIWPLDRAVILCPGRRLGTRFLAAEPAWILSGSNRLDEIAPYAPKIADLSDDGLFMAGAYGVPLTEQLPYVVGALAADPQTRQAVMTFWRPRPGRWKDIPCTISVQFLIRDGRLHGLFNMRSSDVWYGMCYDVHSFAMIVAFVGLHLAQRWKQRPFRPDNVCTDLGNWVENPLLGNLYVTAGSQHLYKLDAENATACAARSDEAFDLAPVDLTDFGRPRDLTQHLWSVARREGVYHGAWLTETMR